MEVILLLITFLSTVLFCGSFIRTGSSIWGALKERYISKTAKSLDDMFMKIDPKKILTLSLLLSGTLALVGLIVTFSFIVGGLLGVIGFFAPRQVIRRLEKRRLEKFGDQLVSALDTISNALKAGFSVPQGFEMISREMPAPISQEFALLLREHRLGVPLIQALKNLNERVPIEDLELVVSSITISTQVGGNLVETLERIAQTVRERKRIQGKIDCLTSQGKLQGIIVSLMPVFLGTILYIIQPDLITPLFTSFIGYTMILTMVILEVVGALIIRKIVSIEV